jgi:hypothetical protein
LRFNFPILILASLVALFSVGCQTSHSGFYPLGIYSVSNTNDLKNISQAGFNLVAGSAEKHYLDAAANFGLKVLASPHTSAGTNFNALAARKAISLYDQHPALWAWYLIDEPDLNRVPPNEVLESHRFLKNIGAKKPTALVIFQGYSALHYAGLSDILMVDRYPIPWLPLANFPQHVRMARLGAAPKQPLIAVIQAFDWTYYPDQLRGESNLRPPTFSELRCMTYAALASRANGLFYYCFNDGRWKMPEHNETWEPLQKVVAEVRSHQPLFSAQHIWWAYRQRFKEPTKRFNEALESSITLSLLRVKRGTAAVPSADYVLAVNNTPETLNHSFQSPVPNHAVINVLGEDRLLVTRNNWIDDTFEPYAVHIYGPILR